MEFADRWTPDPDRPPCLGSVGADPIRPPGIAAVVARRPGPGPGRLARHAGAVAVHRVPSHPPGLCPRPQRDHRAFGDAGLVFVARSVGEGRRRPVSAPVRALPGHEGRQRERVVPGAVAAGGLHDDRGRSIGRRRRSSPQEGGAATATATAIHQLDMGRSGWFVHRRRRGRLRRSASDPTSAPLPAACPFRSRSPRA